MGTTTIYSMGNVPATPAITYILPAACGAIYRRCQRLYPKSTIFPRRPSKPFILHSICVSFSKCTGYTNDRVLQKQLGICDSFASYHPDASSQCSFVQHTWTSVARRQRHRNVYNLISFAVHIMSRESHFLGFALLGGI